MGCTLEYIELHSFAGFFVGTLKPIEDFHSLGLDHTTPQMVGYSSLSLLLLLLSSRGSKGTRPLRRERGRGGAKQPIFEA